MHDFDIHCRLNWGRQFFSRMCFIRWVNPLKFLYLFSISSKLDSSSLLHHKEKKTLFNEHFQLFLQIHYFQWVAQFPPRSEWDKWKKFNFIKIERWTRIKRDEKFLLSGQRKGKTLNAISQKSVRNAINF